MARYLLSSNPLQILNPDNTKASGYWNSPVVWVIGHGLVATVSRGASSTHGIGWVQTDGTCCWIDQVNTGYSARRWLAQWVNGPKERFVFTNLSVGFDLEFCYDSIGSVAVNYLYGACYRGDDATCEGTIYVARGAGKYNLYSRVSGAAQLLISDFTGDTVDYGKPCVSFAGDGRYYVVFSSGRCCLLDAVNQETVYNDRWIDDFGADPDVYTSYTTYCYGLGVFASAIYLTETNANGYHESELRIYANEGDPTQLLGPTPTPAMAEMTHSVLEVQLLGAQDDPVEGMLVDWAVAGGGTLASSQSTTDLDGKALMDYYGPAETAGDVTITAQVSY